MEDLIYDILSQTYFTQVSPLSWPISDLSVDQAVIVEVILGSFLHTSHSTYHEIPLILQNILSLTFLTTSTSTALSWAFCLDYYNILLEQLFIPHLLPDNRSLF